MFNTSTGSDHPYTLDGVARTPRTRPRACSRSIRQVDGSDKGPLGQLYRPKYFTDTGIAVHGYTDVPPYPASHGCVRVSNTAIDCIWANNILPIGARSGSTTDRYGRPRRGACGERMRSP